MADIPNLAGVATSDLVEKIGSGNFQASYINWSRTLHLLRENAAGWLPEAVVTAEGGILHRAPVGGFLLLRFRHSDGTTKRAVLTVSRLRPVHRCVHWRLGPGCRRLAGSWS